MAISNYDELLTALRDRVVSSSLNAHETQYDRGVFDAYAEAYSEVCDARARNGSLSAARVYLEAWATAIEGQFEEWCFYSEHLCGMNDTALKVMAFFEKEEN